MFIPNRIILTKLPFIFKPYLHSWPQNRRLMKKVSHETDVAQTLHSTGADLDPAVNTRGSADWYGAGDGFHLAQLRHFSVYQKSFGRCYQSHLGNQSACLPVDLQWAVTHVRWGCLVYLGLCSPCSLRSLSLASWEGHRVRGLAKSVPLGTLQHLYLLKDWIVPILFHFLIFPNHLSVL